MRRSTVLYLVASAVVAYLYGFPTNGLSHFDEGQYAFARVWPWVDRFDVDQAFFSPPLYPFLVGLVQHLPITRPDLAGVYISWAACWASLYFGVKLAVAWWGRSAALPAFVLLLLSPMRLAFGTIGLTDALFSALLLATLWFGTNAFCRNSVRWTLAAALMAGSTWSCKYNGFIALGILAGFLLHRRTPGAVLRWLVIAFIAAAIMAPWYWAIHTHHPEGIAALQRHQQGYLRGLTLPVLWENLRHASGLRAVVPGLSTFLFCWLLLGSAVFAGRRWPAALGAAMLLAAEESSLNRLLPSLGVLLLPCSLRSARPVARAPVALAVGLTTFLPGIYTPYLRLWLPAEHVLLLVIAGTLAGAARSARTARSTTPVVAVAALLLLFPSCLKVAGHAATVFKIPLRGFLSEQRVALDRARTPMRPVEGYNLAAQELVDQVNARDPDRLLVYARPPLLFYLAHSRLQAPVRRLPDERPSLELAPAGTLIVADVAVRDSKQFAGFLRDARRRRTLQRLNGWWASPHPLTVLDDFGGDDWRAVQDYKVHLYLFAPFSGSSP